MRETSPHPTHTQWPNTLVKPGPPWRVILFMKKRQPFHNDSSFPPPAKAISERISFFRSSVWKPNGLSGGPTHKSQPSLRLRLLGLPHFYASSYLVSTTHQNFHLCVSSISWLQQLLPHNQKSPLWLFGFTHLSVFPSGDLPNKLDSSMCSRKAVDFPFIQLSLFLRIGVTFFKLFIFQN